MPPYSLVKSSNDAYCPPYTPTVVVFGGTSGIGKAMAKRLGEQLQGRIHIIIVGRNKAAADDVFNSLPLPPAGDGDDDQDYVRKFVSCDLSLMKNLRKATEEISKIFPKINYIIMTSGQATFGRKRETEEGIDSQLVMRYYWKFAAINDLLPGLRAAGDAGEAAGAFSVLGNGLGPKIDFNDLGGRKNHYLGVVPLMQGAVYGDLMLSMYAEKEHGIAFTHMFPGMVDTEANSPAAFNFWLWKFFAALIIPLAWAFFIRVEVSAENMVYGLLSGEKGFYQRDTKANSVGPRNVNYTEEQKKIFWEHCLEATRSVPR
ncbi:hypothetical protein DFP72DRAFT_919988 [Ephemerocybe angulata]|uniref:NAD(P)-binding protein n=1 Tax=Ephemerocybe angulata TaxID=980116 RepID=A0A8H6HKE6_9AGAR|nr:hypothetical protein DFP72DRAFT_919988 [Tulosesus angulatus]